MSTKKGFKKVSILSVPDYFDFIIGDVPCVVHFQPSLGKVTFVVSGYELPKIGNYLNFLNERFIDAESVKIIVVESINS